MRITAAINPRLRCRLRKWLEDNHSSAKEVWVLYDRVKERKANEITYLDIVEECICFGWIDGTCKKHEGKLAHRITPRRPKSNWTELNKYRASVMITKGLMRPAGHAILPDLDGSEFQIPKPIELALRAEPEVWDTFMAFPSLYQRIRVSYVAEMLKCKDDEAYRKRLNNLIKKTQQKKMFGNWDDSKLARTGP